MNGVRAIKLLGLILGVVLLNIIVLSPGLLGVEIGGTSVFETALGVTLLFVSLLVILYGSYILLFKPSSIPAVKTLKSYEDYIAALTQYKNVKVLKKTLRLL